MADMHTVAAQPHTFTKTYRLPAEVLGGLEIDATEVWGGCAGGRPEYILPGGFTLLAPAGQPLDLAVPEEPGPGAYLIGGVYVVRPAAAEQESRWCLPANHGTSRQVWQTWTDTWAQLGPGVTIQRLAPESRMDGEPVQLPLVVHFGDSRRIVIAPPPGDSDGVASLSMISGYGSVLGRADLHDVAAEDIARALVQLVRGE